MMKTVAPIKYLLAISSVSLMTLASCADDSSRSEDVGNEAETVGDGDGDGDTGDGDGDADTGDGDGDTGDGDGDTGDGDGDTGDGDGDTGDGDGDGDGDPETCEDGIQNQDESDIDCGGTLCDTCGDGASCLVGEDCMAGQCVDNMCFSGCIDDEACADLNDECNVGVCNAGMCETAPANEGGDCASGDLCLVNGMCTAGACMEEPLDCTGLDDQCSVGVCNPDDGSCVAEVANEGMACDDGDSCSDAEVCTAGECIDPGGGTLFYDEFANNNAGWTLGTEWQIGSAVLGCGDPGTDHTLTDNNGVAGVVLGGCATISLHDYYCLTSPIIDTAGQASVWMTYYRDLYSDFTPYMKNKLEVFNGVSWVILFETFGSPGVNDANWTYFGYDVSAHANANMQFRWCHNIGSSGAFSRGSWNVDDVTVAKNQCNAAD
jgi:hypothetical protein